MVEKKASSAAEMTSAGDIAFLTTTGPGSGGEEVVSRSSF